MLEQHYKLKALAQVTGVLRERRGGRGLGWMGESLRRRPKVRKVVDHGPGRLQCECSSSIYCSSAGRVRVSFERVNSDQPSIVTPRQKNHVRLKPVGLGAEKRRMAEADGNGE